MEPTICEDDLVVLNREVSELTYGDIVVCHYEGDKDLKPFNEIYRIVGLPGDSIVVEGDICVINGKKNNAKYIRTVSLYDEYEEELPNQLKISIKIFTIEIPSQTYPNKGTVIVDHEHYFLLSDSRSGAIDSRYFGPMSQEQILGKVIKVIKS